MAVTLTSSYKLICSKNTSTYSTLRLYGKLDSQDSATNTSSITLQARIYGNGGQGSWSSGSISITATSGTSTSSTGSISYSKGSETTLKTLTTTVAHNSDGTYSNKSVSTSLTTSASPSGTASGTITLPTIPRATQPVANPNPVDIGQTTIISTPRASQTFYHILSYVFGSLSGTLTNLGTDSYDWTIPNTFYNEFTATEKQKDCNITCVTMSGSTTIGTKTLTLGIKIPDSSAPTYSNVSKAETNQDVISAIGSSMSKAIIGLSKPRYQMTLQSQNGATLSSATIKCGDLTNTITLSGSSYSLDYTFQNAMTSNIVQIITTDSRGLQTTYTDTYTDYQTYKNPTITYQSVERTDVGTGTVTFNFQGTLQPKQLDGTTANTITFVYKYRRSDDSTDWSSITPHSVTPTYNTDNDIWYVNQNVGTWATYNYMWQIQITIADSSSQSNPQVRTYTINKAVPSMSLGENDLQINGDLYLADTDGNNAIDVKNELSKIPSSWTYVDKKTGATTIAIPNGAIELYAIGRIADSDNVAFAFYIPVRPSSTMRFNAGYTQTTSYNARCTIEVTTTTVGLQNVYLNGTNTLSTSTLELYYRK